MDAARQAALTAELDDAKRDRDRLNAYIETLSIRLGLPAETSDEAVEEVTGPPAGALTDDVASLVYANEFHGKSIPKAAETVLRRWSPPPVQRPIKTTDLLTALRKGGLSISESRSVYRSLYDHSRFHRLKGGLWGLAEWYPSSMRSQGARGAAVDDPAAADDSATTATLRAVSEPPDAPSSDSEDHSPREGEG